MKNYAGSRLSPWLGHLMVSRQETARPLLTPGEVMQLPPEDELVLVSGVPPIRAKKTRYFEDPRLVERVLFPHEPDAFGREAGIPSDDWSLLSASPIMNAAKGDVLLDFRQPADDSANSGIRREPQLPAYQDIAPEASPPPPEFDFAEDEGDGEAIRARVLRRNISGLARQAAMDPGDGLDL
jgi:type IV secretion system protein VirD4